MELLAQIGIKPNLVLSPQIDETPLKSEKPLYYVKRMAFAKASKISELYPQDIIIAADTIVAVGTRILPAPKDMIEAERFLRLISGRNHRVYTSIAVYNKEIRTKTVMSLVKFKHLHEKEIKEYLNSMEWEGKAGAYAIQGRAAAFIKHISGSYSNIVGLPLYELKILMPIP